MPILNEISTKSNKTSDFNFSNSKSLKKLKLYYEQNEELYKKSMCSEERLKIDYCSMQANMPNIFRFVFRKSHIHSKCKMKRDCWRKTENIFHLCTMFHTYSQCMQRNSINVRVILMWHRHKNNNYYIQLICLIIDWLSLCGVSDEYFENIQTQRRLFTFNRLIWV